MKVSHRTVTGYHTLAYYLQRWQDLYSDGPRVIDPGADLELGTYSGADLEWRI